ncbi:MAG: hypothetical protein ACR2HN_03505 [Tepidiformaceae bacterium]
MTEDRPEQPVLEAGALDDDVSSLASVVEIDRYEDIGTICGRVDTAPTFAVVIHAPRGNRQLTTELGMRRLQRHADESGRAIAIATTAVALASRARQVGMPVARRPEYVRWESGGRRVVQVGKYSLLAPALGRYVQLGAIIAVAAVFFVLAIAAAPSAKIVAYPPVETLTRTVEVTASTDRDEIDFERLAVPASQVSAQRTLTFAVKTTGKARVFTGPAVVTVSINNPGASAVTIPKGAVLLTANGTRFLLDAQTPVAPRGASTQSVTSESSSPQGAFGPGSVTTWEDVALKPLIVTNPAAATGPSQERAVVAPEDIASIRALARALETSGALKRIILEERPHDAVFLATATVTAEVDEPDDPAGTPVDLLLMDVTVTVSALAIPSETLDELARRVLRADSLGEFIPGSVTAVETGSQQVAEDGSIKAAFLLRGELARSVTRDEIKAAVKGKSAEDAKSTLASRYGIQRADVKVTPGWAPWLPRFDFRVSVELRSESADAREGAEGDGPTPTPAPTNRASPAATPSPRP